jgi:hypothetical protein
MNFIHFDDVNDGGHDTKDVICDTFKALFFFLNDTIFINPNYGKYVTFVLNLLQGILRFSNHFTTCMWPLYKCASTTSISKAIIVVVYAMVIAIAICVKQRFHIMCLCPFQQYSPLPS